MITGAGGQLGRCLRRSLERDGARVVAFDSTELDVADGSAVAARLDAAGPLDVLANAAAFTQVDRCESEVAQAERVNAEAPGTLARLCDEREVKLVHVSTDYVFDGTASEPYREEDPPSPRSIYGRTKLQGERRVLEASAQHLVVRSSWLFGPGRNFVRTLLALGARAGSEPLRVVDDQCGRPTYTGDLSDGLLALVEAGASGLYHLANRGVASWWDLAREALDRGGFEHVAIRRVSTDEFPRPAPRPAFSVLDCGKAEALGVTLPEWQEAVARYLGGPDSPLAE